MPTIDDKVVAMSFENSRFERGVSQSLSTLDKLKSALNFQGAGKGLDSISKSAKSVDVSHISRGVDEVASRLDALRLTAIAVFSQIATRAVSAAAGMTKALTV